MRSAAEKLGSELLDKIFDYLPLNELQACHLVCQAWRHCVEPRFTRLKFKKDTLLKTGEAAKKWQRWPGVKKLGFSLTEASSISDIALFTFQSNAKWANIETVHLRNGTLGLLGAQSFVEMAKSNWENLKYMHLVNIGLRKATLQVFASTTWHSLEVLDLSRNDFTYNAWDLGPFLQKIPRLRKLSLSSALTDNSLRHLVDYKLPALEEFHAPFNNLGTASMLSVASNAAGSWPNLKLLNFSFCNNLNEGGLIALFRSPLAKLEKLDIRGIGPNLTANATIFLITAMQTRWPLLKELILGSGVNRDRQQELATGRYLQLEVLDFEAIYGTETIRQYALAGYDGDLPSLKVMDIRINSATNVAALSHFLGAPWRNLQTLSIFQSYGVKNISWSDLSTVFAISIESGHFNNLKYLELGIGVFTAGEVCNLLQYPLPNLEELFIILENDEAVVALTNVAPQNLPNLKYLGLDFSLLGNVGVAALYGDQWKLEGISHYKLN